MINPRARHGAGPSTSRTRALSLYPPLSALHAPRICIADISSDLSSEYFPESLAATSEWNDDFDLNVRISA